MINDFLCLRVRSYRGFSRALAKLLMICLIVSQFGALAKDEHGANEPVNDGKTKTNISPLPPSKAAVIRDSCSVDSQAIIRFVNRDYYDLPSMVSFVTSPECQESARLSIAKEVDFPELAPPYNLKKFLPSALSSDPNERRRLQNTLSEEIPALLRQYPLNSAELLPVLGQSALLGAGIPVLVSLIEQQAATADTLLRSSKVGSKELTQMAKVFVDLGANKQEIMSGLANSIKDLALLAQANSLGAIFRSLAAVSTVEASLVPTFNQSAEALNEGVQRGKDQYSLTDKSEMIAALLSATQAALASSASLEPAVTEFGEALSALLKGYPVKEASLRKMWKDAIKVLEQTDGQFALAQAVSLSLTPEMVFLSQKDMDSLLAAAGRYPVLALAMQQNFLAAWTRMQGNRRQERLSSARFALMRKQIMEPLVSSLMSLPYLDYSSLREMMIYGLVRDQDIVRLFPRAMLGLLQRRELASQWPLAHQSEIQDTVHTMAENLSVVWSLSTIHVPTLLHWVEKQKVPDSRE